MNTFTALVGLLPLVFLFCGFTSRLDQPLGGIQSQYTSLVSKIARAGQTFKELEPVDGKPQVLALDCIDTPGNRFYVGIKQRMIINAPVAAVVKILDDFADYTELFPDLKETKVLAQGKDTFTLFWEYKTPPLIPNVKFELLYATATPVATKKIYLYQLKSSNHLKFSDGLIVVEERDGKTYYLEYDFFDANWGIAKTFAPGRIWKDSIADIYLSDVGIKLKAENPSMDYDAVRANARSLFKSFPLEAVLHHRVPLAQILDH